MQICILGTGYVGLSIGVCLAEIGHNVTCLDKDTKKLEQIEIGQIPIYEPKIEELIIKNTKENRLKFSTDYKNAIGNADICYIAVGTPSKENGDVDFSQVEEAIENIAKSITKYTLIINKSTVPIGSAQKTKEKLSKLTNIEFDIVSNPEFLWQGSAVDDFLNPERIVIGTSNTKAKEIIKKLYAPLKIEEKIIFTDENSAEMIKYASNSFLAVKISFMNEIANLCEKIGANIKDVQKGIGLDSRIGDKFLNSGIGFGGSCFPKDISAIINIAKENDCNLEIINSAKFVNQNQKDKFIEKILKEYDNNIKDKNFAVWGLAFKPNTNDTREAPAKYIIEKLITLGAKIKAYDPKAKLENINQVYKKEEALDNADALIIFTEWDEFKKADIKEISEKLKDKMVFDGRKIFNPEEVEKNSLKYIYVGKNEQ